MKLAGGLLALVMKYLVLKIGMIVGSYFVGSGGGQLPQNGFMYDQGKWATLNYPTSLFTDLVG